MAVGEQAEFVATTAQAESLPPSVKPLVLIAFKGWMDRETILTFIH